VKHLPPSEPIKIKKQPNPFGNELVRAHHFDCHWANVSSQYVIHLLNFRTVVQQFQAAGNTGNVSVMPLLALFANCTFWLKYGFLLEEPVIYGVNGFGLLISCICLFYYYKYSQDRIATEKQMLFTFLFTTLVLLYVRLFYASNVAQVTEQLGLLCCLASICMFGAPLLSLSKVIKTKSVSGHIIFPVAILSSIVCILWTLIGSYLRDDYIFYPNLIGSFLAFGQVGVYIKYKNVKMIHVLPTKVDMEERDD
jgi:solute carrier family 50 protein (sugar transporter)